MLVELELMYHTCQKSFYVSVNNKCSIYLIFLLKWVKMYFNPKSITLIKGILRGKLTQCVMHSAGSQGAGSKKTNERIPVSCSAPSGPGPGITSVFHGVVL